MRLVGLLKESKSRIILRMNFLFPTPFFGIDNFLSENAVKDLHNQILEDISKNEGYVNSQWDCLVNTSGQRDDSVTYPMFSFKEII